MIKALTDRFCASAPAGEYADGLNRGLILIVRPSTAKDKPDAVRRSWQLRIVYKGKRIKRGLGAYPAPTSLQAARRATQEARQAIFEGGEQPPAAVPEAYTFGLAASQFLADVARPYKNPRDEIIRNRALKVHAARFNDLPVDQVTPRAVASLLKALKPETAVKTRTVLNKVFAFAGVELAQKSITMRNPASLDLLNAVGYQPPRASQRKRQPAVDYKQMPEVMAVLADIPTIAARCVEFIILTVRG